jgi:hypothetical protein
MSRLRNLYVVALTVLCLVTVVNFAAVTFIVLPKISGSIQDNCSKIHHLTATLDQILINGRVAATRYERDGTITRAQLNRALRDNDVARRKLYRAACPAGEAPALK